MPLILVGRRSSPSTAWCPETDESPTRMRLTESRSAATSATLQPLRSLARTPGWPGKEGRDRAVGGGASSSRRSCSFPSRWSPAGRQSAVDNAVLRQQERRTRKHLMNRAQPLPARFRAASLPREDSRMGRTAEMGSRRREDEKLRGRRPRPLLVLRADPVLLFSLAVREAVPDPSSKDDFPAPDRKPALGAVGRNAKPPQRMPRGAAEGRQALLSFALVLLRSVPAHRSETRESGSLARLTESRRASLDAAPGLFGSRSC